LKEQLEKYVKDPNHITNPLLPGSNSFPYVYLWSACADWAINSSMDFTDKFSLKNGGLDWSKPEDPRYERIRKSLKLRESKKTIVFSCISSQTFDNKSSVVGVQKLILGSP